MIRSFFPTADSDAPAFPRRGLTVLAAVAASAGLALAGCSDAEEPDTAAEGGGETEAEESGSANVGDVDVLTTFTILADITQEIAGDELEVASLTLPGAEIHGYDPTPGDITAAANADLVISNGLGLENWVDRLLVDSDATRVEASEGVEAIDIENTDHPNPHAWMSPKEALTYVDNITKALSEYRPESAETFEQNAEAYKEKISEVGEQMLAGLEELPENHRVLSTCEGAFSYLARDADLEENYIWAVNSDEEITPQHIRRAVEGLEENEVPAQFCESTVDDGPKEQVIEEADHEVRDGGTLYVDSLTEEDGDAPTYLDLLTFDAETIVSGLTGEGDE